MTIVDHRVKVRIIILVKFSSQFIDTQGLILRSISVKNSSNVLSLTFEGEYLQVNETHSVLNFPEFVNNFIFLISWPGYLALIGPLCCSCEDGI